MSKESIAAQIGTAWRFQREGKTDAAVAEFERVLKQAPDDIDAHYGMALTQRLMGNKQDALRHFEKALQLVENARGARQSQRGDAYTPNTTEDDRYMMLARMINQRISEIKAAN
jgi:tetratricopeptide (TPR) repeat protein